MEIFTRKWSEMSGNSFCPEYYHYERDEVVKKLKEKYKNNLFTLKNLVDFSSQKSTAKNVEKYIGMANIESNTSLYLDSNEDKGQGDCHLFNRGEILFNKLRPYLNKVYLAEFSGGCSTEFVVFKSKDEQKISNKFLSIFLFLDCVVNQTKHLMTGNTLPRLQTFDIENLLIPIPPKEIQEQIIDIMDNAYLEKKCKESEAQKILDSIDSFLLTELGINLPPKATSDLEKRIFFVKLSEISGNRFDPQAYLPFYANYKKSIQNSTYPCKTLRDLIVHNVSGSWGIGEQDLEKTQDNFQKCLIIRSTEFGKYDLNVDSNKKQYRFIEKTKLNKLHICSGDILIEKSGGSENQPVGRVVFLTDKLLESENICFSNFIQKITLNNEVNKEYVFCCLHTFHSTKLTENMQSQTNGIRNLILNEYLNLKIPLPPLSVQEKIADEITKRKQKALNLQKEAKECLNSAKIQVEKIILGQ